MLISYRGAVNFEGWDKFPEFIQGVVLANSLKRICEVGAGANPALSPDFVREHRLYYVAIDNSEEEVDKSGLDAMSVVDICAPGAKLPDAPYDLICSRMAAEHFVNAKNAYTNMLNSLAPGGLCVHSFATLYTLPFVLNRLCPESLSDFTLQMFQPDRDRDKHDKFKAFYSNCRGPMKSQLRFFQDVGYEVVEYRGYFGHSYYKRRLPPLHFLERLKVDFLLKVPMAFFTSYATVILRRPVNS